jgi:hypothetical protein
MRLPSWCSWFLFKRGVRFFIQRHTRGFSDDDLWSFDHTLAKHIAPRLRRFQEIRCGYPGNITDEKWEEILSKMTAAFELIGSEEYWDWKWSKEDEEGVDEGLDLFREYYHHLWY